MKIHLNKSPQIEWVGRTHLHYTPEINRYILSYRQCSVIHNVLLNKDLGIFWSDQMVGGGFLNLTLFCGFLRDEIWDRT